MVFEAAFRAIQRAIMRPARETLFTVVSREDKYKSKAFIDTFVYRGGDVVGGVDRRRAGTLGGGVLTLTSLVIPSALAWAGLSIWLARRQATLAAASGRDEGKVSAPSSPATL